MNTTTPDERSEKEGLAREPRELSSEELRELSSEELESIIGGVGIELGSEDVVDDIESISDRASASLPYSVSIRILGRDIAVLNGNEN